MSHVGLAEERLVGLSGGMVVVGRLDCGLWSHWYVWVFIDIVFGVRDILESSRSYNWRLLSEDKGNGNMQLLCSCKWKKERL